MTAFYDHFKDIIPHIKPKDFQSPLVQTTDGYFPDFFTQQLNNYVDYYKNNLVQHIDTKVPFGSTNKDIVIGKIESLSKALIKTLELFYLGKIHEATSTFNLSLDGILFDEIQAISSIKVGTNFYRARKNENKHFVKSDLFHIKFELRHIVSTNRYSVPGFPALYLGDSTYVCWEEFDKHKLRDLWFTRLTNVKELNLIQIQRIEDFLLELNTINHHFCLTFLLRYLITFPLTIACSIKVKFPNGNFKPEYIIPQLLLQYISKNDKIDGIKFPSTKVDYIKLSGVAAYNYVFPVKKIEKIGFCSKLIDTFHSTEPTSLELEEIIYNPTTHPVFLSESGLSSDKRYIELVEKQQSYYLTTSFGKIENSLKQKKAEKL